MSRAQGSHMADTIPGTDLPMLDLFSVRKEHADILHQWIIDPRTRRWLDLGGGRQDLLKRDLYMMITSPRNHARLFALPGERQPLGVICLNGCTNLMGSAEGWCVRGVYNQGPRNASASACVLILASGFIDLAREVIGSWAVDCNRLSIAMHAKVGLKPTGRVRSRHLMNGRYHDRILFDMTRNEFAELYPDVPSESGRTMRQLHMNGEPIREPVDRSARSPG